MSSCAATTSLFWSHQTGFGMCVTVYLVFVSLLRSIWFQVVAPQSAVKFVRNMVNQKKAGDFICKELVEMALVRGSTDNITVVMISFHPVKGNEAPAATISGSDMSLHGEDRTKRRRTEINE